MKSVFICSPYRGDIKENSQKTKYYASIAAHCDVVPVAPHLYFPIFLDDNDPAERMLGISLGIELMKTCNELWLFGFKITEGMKFELEKAKEMKLPIRLYDEQMKRIGISTLAIDERFDDVFRAAIQGLELLQ